MGKMRLTKERGILVGKPGSRADISDEMVGVDGDFGQFPQSKAINNSSSGLLRAALLALGAGCGAAEEVDRRE